MDILLLCFLFVFGTLFGSFASVIIHRLKSGESGIMVGRSKCPKCEKNLCSIDLIPIFSYISTFGKCRYCKKKISIIYPILELTTGILFMLVGKNLIDLNLLISGNLLETYKIIFFLILAFISILIIFYDILFYEVNEGILLVGVIISLITTIIQTINPEFRVLSLGGEIVIGSHYQIISIFIIIFTILSLYFIMLKGMTEILDSIVILLCIAFLYIFSIFSPFATLDIAAISSAIGALSIFIFFFLQILISRGNWLGGGDLRIAILIGIILGASYSFEGLMITYISGSIIGILIILIQKLKHKKKVNTMIPFGPFLMIGLWCTLLWQKEIGSIVNLYL